MQGIGMRSDDRGSRQRRRSPPRPNRRSDERNIPPAKHDMDNIGLTPPAPTSLAKRINEMGGGSGRPSFVPPPPKFSGAAFTEAELLNDIPKKKFTGRCRLFVGNLPLELTEAELKEMFSPHGEISECYLSGKGFAFLRLDSRAHAESAKDALDGKMVKNRQVRVRFAVHGATIKIKELSPVVSNEMLYLTFSAFGEVERAVHIVDEKGKPTGEGIIEFERKTSAQEAIAQIKERVFLLTANSRPLQCDILEPKDEEDGFSEKMISKTHQLIKERELGPRFAAMNSFEYVYGRRWKDLYEYENKRRQELEAELREQRRRLDSDMEVAYEDYKAELLREELQRRQEELERLDAARRARDAQRHQMMMEPMGGDRWVPPPLVDGPLGRPPPPFGAGGGMGGGGLRPPPPGGLMIPPPPFGQGPPPGNDMGGMPMGLGGGGGGPMGPGGGGGPRDGGQQQNGHGKHTPPMPQIDTNLRKLLQSFKDPVIPGGPNPGGQQGGPIRFPPPMNPLDRNTEPCPLSAFANMLQNPRGNDGGGGPLGGGPGGPPPRIPPPPPPMGLNKPPMMMDFPPPPDKRSRR